MSGESTRYSRQVLFAPIGAAGQEQLRRSSVGLVGLGALGSAIAELLVRAGIGRLVAVDRDIIEWSNLHRQGLYGADDAAQGRPKAVAAGQRLKQINPDVEIDTRAVDLGPANAEAIFAGCDLLIDGTDSFETRYLLNDLAVSSRRPWIYGACVAASGLTVTILPGETPCLACLFPEPPPSGSQETCDSVGIIAPAASIVASIQVTEALKILTGRLDALRRSLLSIELWPFRIVEIGGRNPAPLADCPVCGQRRFDFLSGREKSRTQVLCGRDSVQVTPGRPLGSGLDDLARRLAGVGRVRCFDTVLHIDTEGLQVSIFPDGRALIRGTTEAERARAIYARLIGL